MQTLHNQLAPAILNLKYFGTQAPWPECMQVFITGGPENILTCLGKLSRQDSLRLKMPFAVPVPLPQKTPSLENQYFLEIKQMSVNFMDDIG